MGATGSAVPASRSPDLLSYKANCATKTIPCMHLLALFASSWNHLIETAQGAHACQCQEGQSNPDSLRL